MTGSAGRRLFLNLLGTVVLLAGFFYLLGRVPFLPQTTNGTGEAAAVSAGRALPRQLALETGAAQPVSTPAGAAHGPGRLDPTFGLFKADFSALGMGTGAGFTTREYRVAGDCSGAGRRHIEQVCPNCTIVNGGPGNGRQEALVWSDPEAAPGKVFAVGLDCARQTADGSVLVDVLEVGGDTIDLADAGSRVANNQVPLLPGGDRLATFEMGEWLATIDTVARPEAALNDMAAALTGRGWREAKHGEADDVRVFEEQRVFVGADDAVCVVTLNREGDSVQLLTLMSHQTRG